MTRKEILDEASRIVSSDRNATHGEPEKNFQNIADIWSAWRGGPAFTPVEVAVMMILVKVARINTSPSHPDHWTDIAGYAACGGECATKHKCNFRSRVDGSSICDTCGATSPF